MVSRTSLRRALPPLAAMVASALGAFSAAAAEAPGIVATYDVGRPGVVLVVEVAPDGRGRFEERREGEPVASYTLVEPGGRNIVVMRRGADSSGSGHEEWVAMDGRDTPASLDAPAARDPYESQERFRAAGEARVGERTGTRYLLPLEPFTHAQIEEVVVLRDPELAPLGRMLAASSRHAWEGGPAPAAPYMVHMAELISDGAPLRLGDRWTLVSLERRPIDPARLEPPARFLTREQIERSRPREPQPPPRATR